MSPKNKKSNSPELNGFELNLNPFGSIDSTVPIDKINAFLNKNEPNDKSINDQLNTEKKEEQDLKNNMLEK